jgi:cytoskeletal protein CcmA (bactofilin family)
MRKKVEVSDLIGEHTDLEGTLRCPGDMMIDGHFKGDIAASGTLVIGHNATIEANIRAPYVVVGGDIYGNIVADQGIEILAHGKVFGNIQAPSFAIDEGGVFEGHCQMEGEVSAGVGPSLVKPNIPLLTSYPVPASTLPHDHPATTQAGPQAIRQETEA